MALIIDTPDALNEFIVRKTNDFWDKNKAPYLLSYVTTDLAPLGANYRSIIGEGITLKQYVAGLPSVIRDITSNGATEDSVDSFVGFRFALRVGANHKLHRVNTRIFFLNHSLTHFSSSPDV